MRNTITNKSYLSVLPPSPNKKKKKKKKQEGITHTKKIRKYVKQLASFLLVLKVEGYVCVCVCV